MPPPEDTAAICVTEGETPHEIKHTFADPRPADVRIHGLNIALGVHSRLLHDQPADPIGWLLAAGDRITAWIQTGQDPIDLTGVGFGPGVACSCGPDSVAHTHDAPWGCTTCGCRWYPNPDPEAVNETEAPEDAAHRFASELARLDAGLAKRGIYSGRSAPVGGAPVDTALAAVDRLTRDVNTLRLDVADLLPEDAVETPEQSAAIVDGNLAAMGLTVDQRAYRDSPGVPADADLDACIAKPAAADAAEGIQS